MKWKTNNVKAFGIFFIFFSIILLACQQWNSTTKISRCFDIILDNGKTIDIIDALQESCNHATDYKSHEVRVTCKDVIANNQLTTDTISFRKYKLINAMDFINENGEPPNKATNLPPLEKYTVNGKEPRSQIHSMKEVVSNLEIDFRLNKEHNLRLRHGDTDITKIPAVIEEMNNTTRLIPNIVHYIWFGCSEFHVDHYLSMLSVLNIHRPRIILFHTNCEPKIKDYWAAFKHKAGKTLRIVKRTPQEKIWGRKIEVVEHLSDVARLEIMLQVGGIYLDTDSVVLKPLTTFLENYEMVLGEASDFSLANGMILASKKSWFLRRWYVEYKYFDDTDWGHNSVVVPWALWKLLHPKKLHVVEMLFCRPNWKELEYLFQYNYDWENNDIGHLYSRFKPDYDGKAERTIKELAVLNSTYGEISRYILWGDKSRRDVTDWVVTCNLTETLLN